VTEPAHVGEFPVGQGAARSSLIVRDALSQTDSQFASYFLTVLGYCGYPTALIVLTAAPGDAGRALRCASAGRCPPGCHSGQSSGLPSADTLLLVESDGGSHDPLDDRHLEVICGVTRGYATRLAQRAASFGAMIVSANGGLPACRPKRVCGFPARWRLWSVGRGAGA
jgi:hypothetical protein